MNDRPAIEGGTLRLRTHSIHIDNRELMSITGVKDVGSFNENEVILMTDGGPNDDWEDKYQKLQQLGDAGKVQYLGIGIGDDADFDTLRMILPAQPGPVKLKELRFKAFFRWLTDSMKSVSRSAVSAQDSIQFGGIDDWADL